MRPAKELKAGDRVQFKDSVLPGRGETATGTVTRAPDCVGAYVFVDVDVDGLGSRSFRLHRESRVML